MRPGGCDRGSFSLELAVLAPALLLMISFIISVGRVTESRAMVEGAVRGRCRAATINHNGNAATAAQEALHTGHPRPQLRTWRCSRSCRCRAAPSPRPRPAA